jgi:hypothetical protein
MWLPPGSAEQIAASAGFHIMRRRQTDSVQHETGVGEFLAFLTVAALSACAFIFVGSAKPSSVARVVSMDDPRPVEEKTASVSAIQTSSLSPSSVPLPTPRPE